MGLQRKRKGRCGGLIRTSLGTPFLRLPPTDKSAAVAMLGFKVLLAALRKLGKPLGRCMHASCPAQGQFQRIKRRLKRGPRIAPAEEKQAQHRRAARQGGVG